MDSPTPAADPPDDINVAAVANTLPVPYEFVASEELDDAARRLVESGAISVHHIGNTGVTSMRIDGPCPRCGDPYSQTAVLALPDWNLRGKETNTSATDSWADFLCNCDIVHPQAPPNERGCGASYAVTTPKSSND